MISVASGSRRRTGSHAPRGKPPPFGFSRGAYVEPRSAPPSKSKSRQNQNQKSRRCGIKGAYRRRDRGYARRASVTPMKTRGRVVPRSAASSTPDASGLGVFGAGKAPVPVPLGDAGRARSRDSPCRRARRLSRRPRRDILTTDGRRGRRDSTTTKMPVDRRPSSRQKLRQSLYLVLRASPFLGSSRLALGSSCLSRTSGSPRPRSPPPPPGPRRSAPSRTPAARAVVTPRAPPRCARRPPPRRRCVRSMFWQIREHARAASGESLPAPSLFFTGAKSDARSPLRNATASQTRRRRR